MSKVDWSKAPDDAQFYSFSHFRKHLNGMEFRWAALSSWVQERFEGIDIHKESDDFEMRPETPTPEEEESFKAMEQKQEKSMAEKYPAYFKDVSHLKEIDVYAVHQAFDIDDPSGAIQHASKKLLLSGSRTGGKSKFDDIREARDSLNRWLELNKTKV